MDMLLKKNATGQPGTVSRVVPGRLVYVDVPGMGTFPVKPDKFKLVGADGKQRHYRGEPFAQIGVEVGAKVQVISHMEHVGSIVVHPAKANKGFVRRLLNYDF